MYSSKDTISRVEVKLILYSVIFSKSCLPYGQCTFKVLACHKMSLFHCPFFFFFAVSHFPSGHWRNCSIVFNGYRVVNEKSKVNLICITFKSSFESFKELSYTLGVLKFYHNVVAIGSDLYCCWTNCHLFSSITTVNYTIVSIGHMFGKDLEKSSALGLTRLKP